MCHVYIDMCYFLEVSISDNPTDSLLKIINKCGQIVYVNYIVKGCDM